MRECDRIAEAYDGSNATYRLFRADGGCELLMNLGWFPFTGRLSLINMVLDMAKASFRLVTKSVALLDIRQGDAVLDVACGRGKSSYVIAQLHPGSTVTGVDLLPENIQVARTVYGHTPNLRYAVADAMDLGVAAGSFMRVHCLEAAFHFPDRARFLREAYRALCPGGRLVVVDFSWKTPAARRLHDQASLQLLRRIWRWEDFFTIDEYIAAARDAGFLVRHCRDWSRHVSRQATLRVRVASWMGRHAFGRRLMEVTHPLLRGTSDAEWREIRESARASRDIERYYAYTAFVFDKPAVSGTAVSS
jgi:MPBQ/MSBQ methyltransferase